MSINNNEIKNGGIYYTPTELAGFAVNSIINNPTSTILDPCFGHGSLLFAAYNKLVQSGCKEPNKQLYGCDILRPPSKVLIALQAIVDRDNLIESDFFNLRDGQLDSKFDIIIMNPPFVRHHLISSEIKTRLKKATGSILSLSKTSDLWAYFIIRNLVYLNSGGSMLAILPWSFLHSDYSKPIRQYLIDNFKSIKTLSIGKRLFENTQERILVLLAEEYGGKSLEVSACYSYDIPNKAIDWIPVGTKDISESSDNLFIHIEEYKYLYKIAERSNFQPLGNFGDVRIGTVTGANDFFIIRREKAISLGVPDSWLKPIIAKAMEINKCSVIHLSDVQEFVLTIPNKQALPATIQSYIKMAEGKGYKERYHCKKRSEWYSIELKDPPDAFLPYMIKEIPTTILNPDRVRSTNNIHGVYFDDRCTENTLKWIQLSMLSSISQLSIEIFSRTYGSGVLKIEPSEAKKILVFSGNGLAYPKEIDSTVQDLIREGNREQAMNIVDAWFMKNLNISKKEMDNILSYYRKLKEVRLGPY